jgi:hypothetical protein
MTDGAAAPLRRGWAILIAAIIPIREAVGWVLIHGRKAPDRLGRMERVASSNPQSRVVAADGEMADPMAVDAKAAASAVGAFLAGAEAVSGAEAAAADARIPHHLGIPFEMTAFSKVVISMPFLRRPGWL